jgi:hypothetical protein
LKFSNSRLSMRMLRSARFLESRIEVSVMLRKPWQLR